MGNSANISLYFVASVLGDVKLGLLDGVHLLHQQMPSLCENKEILVPGALQHLGVYDQHWYQGPYK